MPADLDDRLSGALGRLTPPTDTEVGWRSVAGRLPRYRARRRARALGGVAGLAGVGLAVGLVVSAPGTPTVSTAAPPTAGARLPAVRSCVQVQVGTGAAECAGQPVVGPAFGAAKTLSGAEAAAVAAKPPRVLTVRGGALLRVVLPPVVGGTWTAVTIERVGTAPPPRSVPFALIEPTVQTIVEVGRLGPGTYLLTALGSSRCPPGAFCTPIGSTRSWQVELNVERK